MSNVMDANFLLGRMQVPFDGGKTQFLDEGPCQTTIESAI